MTPIYIGGSIRYIVEKRSGKDEKLKTQRKEKGILLGSGFIAGEGITMVGVALLAYITKQKPQGIGLDLGSIPALAAFIGLAAFLFWKSYKK
jgi:uncharacterized oligopeptide transporter (OPT) family protein